MIDSESPPPPVAQIPLTVQWSSQADLAQVYVDEAAAVHLNGHVYLTAGQVQVEFPLSAGQVAEASANIRPVTRLVFTETGFHKMLTMLNNIANKIPNPRPANREE